MKEGENVAKTNGQTGTFWTPKPFENQLNVQNGFAYENGRWRTKKRNWWNKYVVINGI
jgi:hypothetical protein